MYTVYIHKNKINQKIYVGLTKQTPQNRWRKNGEGYRSQNKFWSAIQKYGWNNFEHIIIKTNLTAEEAGQLEKDLIKSFNSIQNGYNVDGGGVTPNHSPETIEKIRQAQLGEKSPLYQKPLSKEHTPSCHQHRILSTLSTADASKPWSAWPTSISHSPE